MACGGDVLGSWTIEGVCFSEPPEFGISIDGCEASTQVMSYEASGTLDFSASSLVTIAEDSEAVYSATFPSACLGSISCASLAMVLTYDSSSGTAMSMSSAVCAQVASGCLCDITDAYIATATGTWAASGSTITITFTFEGSSSTADYCVQGTTLHLGFEGIAYVANRG